MLRGDSSEIVAQNSPGEAVAGEILISWKPPEFSKAA
jgi:hypothetical protein